MTREEAYKAMRNGEKVSHQYFSSNEFYELKNTSIIAEDGVNHTRVFWSEDQNNWRNDGWEIYKTN
jgi:hypothetical protein